MVSFYSVNWLIKMHFIFYPLFLFLFSDPFLLNLSSKQGENLSNTKINKQLSINKPIFYPYHFY